MAKLILKSITYYPLAQSGRPEAHKDLGQIDTNKPYKKLVIQAQSKQLYRLVDEATGEVLKSQKMVRDHEDLKVYVGEVVVLEIKDFFSPQSSQANPIDQEPLYMVDAAETTCVRGLIGANDGAQLPQMYVVWEPGMSVSSCLNPSAMALAPLPGLGGVSGLSFSSVLGMSGAVSAMSTTYPQAPSVSAAI